MVADTQTGVGGEARVYCDGARRILSRERELREQEEQEKESGSHGVAN
jgi:hypothetical protein